MADIKNGDCLKIACCDCKLTHNFIVKLKRGKTESGDRATLSIFTDLKTTDSLRNGLQKKLQHFASAEEPSGKCQANTAENNSTGYGVYL